MQTCARVARQLCAFCCLHARSVLRVRLLQYLGHSDRVKIGTGEWGSDCGVSCGTLLNYYLPIRQVVSYFSIVALAMSFVFCFPVRGSNPRSSTSAKYQKDFLFGNESEIGTDHVTERMKGYE